MWYLGTKVGSVSRVDLAPGEVKVYVDIDAGVVMRESYRVSICDLSLLGGHYLLLEEGAGETLPLETTPFVGETPMNFGRSLARTAQKIEDFLSDPRLKSIVGGIETTATNLAEITTSVREGKGTLGKFLSEDDTVYNDIKDSVADFKTTMTNLAVVTTNVREGKGTIGKLLSEDDTVYNDLQRTLASAATVADRLEKGEGLLGRLMKDDDPLYTDLKDAIASFRKACESFDGTETMASAKTLLDNLNVTAERLKNGEGSVGKLLATDEFYNEIQGLTKDVRQVIDNYRDTTPISTFGSLVLGGL